MYVDNKKGWLQKNIVSHPGRPYTDKKRKVRD